MSIFRSNIVAADPEKAEQSLRRISPRIRLGRGADPRHTLEMNGDARFTVLRLTVYDRLAGQTDPDDTVSISTLIKGRIAWSIKDETGAGPACYMAGTDATTQVDYGPMVQIAVVLKKKPLRDWARAFYGDDDLALSFDGARPIDDTRSTHLRRLLPYVHEAASSELFTAPLLRSTLYRYAAVSTLEAFRLRGDRSTRVVTAEGRSRRYRQAVQFLSDHASLPITVEDAASFVGVNVADLDLIFRGHSVDEHGVHAELTAIRLSAAHGDLTNADPTTGLTVAHVAARWGFASTQAFTAAFRRRYRMSPARALAS